MIKILFIRKIMVKKIRIESRDDDRTNRINI
jgi:hypothetical protein